jgi:hypothetical protein
VRLAHCLCEPLRSATAHNCTDVHLWLAKLCAWCSEEDICHQHKFTAAAELRCVSVWWKMEKREGRGRRRHDVPYCIAADSGDDGLVDHGDLLPAL